MGRAANVVYTTVMTLPHDKLRQLIRTVLRNAYPDLGEVEIPLDQTADVTHGDYASTVAMKIAPQLGQPPRDVAQNILTYLGKNVPMLEKAEVAGPGFINFTLKPAWIMGHVKKILDDKMFGSNAIGGGKKMLVEFISANPTGPMTLGNGRGAFAGDTLANALAMSGWRVSREYYVNDIGNQVNILAESVLRRYWQAHGIPTEYPEYCYQGDYVTELAGKLKLDKMKLTDMKTVRDRIKGRILETMVKQLQSTVTKKLGVKFNTWFRESTLHEKKLDEKVIQLLQTHDFLYDKDGALWFRTTAFGDDKDRVLMKADGEKTYFLSDIALRLNRFNTRGFHHEILLLGADHHGYIRRLEAAMAAIGHAKKLEVLIVQLVRLMRDGQEVKMSKRAGTYVALEELIDEVGVDVARFFFLMHGANTHMDFDLNAAKEKSEKNPVYYVQYAHARMHSIMKKIKKQPVIKSKEPPHRSEIELVKILIQFPLIVSEVATSYEVQKLPFYAMTLATKFHEFYDHCRVIDEGRVWTQRLELVKATAVVLKKTLGLMGITAPEKM